MGELLVARLQVIGRGARSRIETDATVAHLWRVEDGLVTVFHVYESEEAAVQAAELLALPETS